MGFYTHRIIDAAKSFEGFNEKTESWTVKEWDALRNYFLENGDPKNALLVSLAFNAKEDAKVIESIGIGHLKGTHTDQTINLDSLIPLFNDASIREGLFRHEIVYQQSSNTTGEIKAEEKKKPATGAPGSKSF